MEHANKEENSQANTIKHDIYTDPALVKPNQNDPIAKWFSIYWSKLLVAIVAILTVVYFVNSYRESYLSSMRSVADSSASLQESYKDLLKVSIDLEKANKELSAVTGDKKDAETKLANTKKDFDDKKGNFQQLLKSLSLSREPYVYIAEVYKILGAKAIGEPISASDFNSVSNWKAKGKPDSDERYYSELAALLLARTFLDDSEKKDTAVKLLNELGKEADYVNVSAAITLANIANSKESQDAALKLLESLAQKQPGQADLLNEEIKRLKALSNAH
jgi:hypothetical protein